MEALIFGGSFKKMQIVECNKCWMLQAVYKYCSNDCLLLLLYIPERCVYCMSVAAGDCKNNKLNEVTLKGGV